MRSLISLSLGVFYLLVALGAQADKVTVAVASNFSEVARKLSATYENQSGHKVVISSASSGKLYAQILHGAPFDVFLSADQDKPFRLESKGKTVPGTRISYAEGSLVLWSATEDIDVMDKLLSGNYRRLALANPKIAPYGKAAEETLSQLVELAQSRPRWVIAENINQAYQFTSTGNAEIGFIAASQLMNHPERGSYITIDSGLHSPITQDAVLLSFGQENKAAIGFMTFLSSEEARSIIVSSGYRLP